MKKTVFELLDEQRELRAEARSIMDKAKAENRDYLEMETRKISAIEKQIAEIESKIEEVRKLPVNLPNAKTTVDQEDPEKGGLTAGDKRSLRQYLEEKRSLTTSTGVPTYIPKAFIKPQENNLFRKYCTVYETNSTTIFPALSAYGTAAITAEGAAFPTNDDTLSPITFNAYRYANTRYVTEEMLNDSAFNWIPALDEAAQKAFTKAEMLAFLSGTGVSQPQGICVGGSSAVTSATTLVIKNSEVLSTIEAMPPEFRDGNEIIIVSPAGMAQIRALSLPSSTTIPLMDPVSRTIAGIPVVVTSFMPTIAAGAVMMAVANLAAGYMVGQRVGGIERMVWQEPWNGGRTGVGYAERIDGKVLFPAAIQLYKSA